MLLLYRALFFFSVALLATGCHFGKLRCVVCPYRRTNVDTVRYENGQLKSIRRREGKGTGMHANYKTTVVTQEFDELGRRKAEYRQQYITIEKSWQRITLKEQWIIYGQDSIRREVHRYRRGRLVKVVRRLR